MKNLFKFVTLISIIGCQTLSQSYLQSGSNNTTTSTAAANDLDLVHIQKQVADGACTDAIQSIQTVQAKMPQFAQLLNLLQGDCELQSEQYVNAEKHLREVTSFTVTQQPKLAAQAYLLLSYVYEGLGDDSKALSAALDAERFSVSLSPQSRLAEVPARLAMLYSEMNDLKQAALYLMQADEGIRVLKTQNPQLLGSSFWAQIYFQMGFKSLEQIDDQNISSSIQGLMAVQKYTLKSLEFEDPNWSQKAFLQIQKNYLVLWTTIQKEAVPNSAHWSADEYKLKEQKTVWLSELLDLITQAQLYKPIENEPQTATSTDFYIFLASLEAKAMEMLQATARKTPLTGESLRLNSIYRSGRVYPSQFFPSEISAPSKLEKQEAQQ